MAAVNDVKKQRKQPSDETQTASERQNNNYLNGGEVALAPLL